MVNLVRELGAEYCCEEETDAETKVSQTSNASLETIRFGEELRERGEHEVENTIQTSLASQFSP